MTDMHPYEALKIALQEARDERDDWRESATRAAGESCGDERHCTCVGPLRKELRDAKAKLAALVAAVQNSERQFVGWVSLDVGDIDGNEVGVVTDHNKLLAEMRRVALAASRAEESL